MHPYTLANRGRAHDAWARRRLRAFIDDADFPCVGAKSALNTDRVRFGHYQVLADTDSADMIRQDLRTFSREFPNPDPAPVSFIALFDKGTSDEASFETALWRQLQAIHEVDRVDHDWDPRVSDDPASPEFSMSIAGRAFFVVGLHPHASRMSRRAPLHCLVFNFHDQFEMLKRSGKYASMQRAIRQRDLALQGSINPVLSRFGEASEARQYSGRAVDDNWVCPFHRQGATHE